MIKCFQGKGVVIINTGYVIAMRINQLCSERHISLQELSARSSVPLETINNIINQKFKDPGILTLKMLCHSFGITLGEFFSTPEFNALAYNNDSSGE